MIYDTPVKYDSPTKIQQEWHLAEDKSLSDIKRRIFIERLSFSNDKTAIGKFIQMYEETKIPELKSKIVIATETYYQNHIEEIKSNYNKSLLRDFYSKLLYQSLPNGAEDVVVRGFLEFHDPEEIRQNLQQIDRQLSQVKGKTLLGLKIYLAHQSVELEKIYIPKIIFQLSKDKDMTEDSMFFYLMNSGCKHLKDLESLYIIKCYLDRISSKYLAKNYDKSNVNYYFARKYLIDILKTFESFKLENKCR